MAHFLQRLVFWRTHGLIDPPENQSMYKLTTDPMLAPDEQYIELEFDEGIVAIDGNTGNPAEIIRSLNKIAGKHGIGRVDLVENRFVGMKEPGCL